METRKARIRHFVLERLVLLTSRQKTTDVEAMVDNSEHEIMTATFTTDFNSVLASPSSEAGAMIGRAEGEGLGWCAYDFVHHLPFVF